jgi:diguanylate cyclase (GGDEF)-like protein
LEYIANDISLIFARVAIDLNYLTKNKMAIRYLSTGDEEAHNDLLSLVELCAEDEGIYDQVRILNKNGDEKIRINKTTHNCVVVPKKLLQNKASRYYFKDSIKLNSGEIYTSLLDLNVEHGEIEKPFKPMIRYAQQIRDERDKVLGVAIINFLGKTFIQKVKSYSNESLNMSIVNKDGYFVLGPNSSMEWGWMFKDKEHITLHSLYPKAWEGIENMNKGITMCKDGVIFFRKITTSPHLECTHRHCKNLTLIMLVPTTVIQELYSKTFKLLMVAFLLVSPLLIFLSFKLASYQVNQKILFAKLNEQATRDGLTELFNRRAILEKLGGDMKLARRRNVPLSIAFIDLNDLKKVNDTIGHEAGDVLIVGLAETLRETLRETDYAARVGGDEFLVVFLDSNFDDTVKIVERIHTIFAQKGEEQMKMVWSMSVGIASIKGNESPEEFIKRADDEMYKNKQAFKKENSLT